ncbi:Gamma-glutamyltranspeptidase 1, partial [Stegodyphus mimosarum]
MRSNSRPLTFKANFALAVAIVDVCLFASLSVSLPTKDYWMPNYESISKLGKYASAAVSTDSAPCAVIGKNILAKNGSAVDAAIAVLLCMGVVNPESQGLGGGFLMLIYKRSEKQVYYLDAREVAPEKAHKDMYKGNATLSKLGGLAIAVPGEIAGYSLAHNKFGVLPWKELFQPTIRICKE